VTQLKQASYVVHFPSTFPPTITSYFSLVSGNQKICPRDFLHMVKPTSDGGGLYWKSGVAQVLDRYSDETCILLGWLLNSHIQIGMKILKNMYVVLPLNTRSAISATIIVMNTIQNSFF